MTSWTSPGQCSGCKHCGMDLDMLPACHHEIVRKDHPHGLNINAALARYCRDVAAGGRLKLREPRDPVMECMGHVASESDPKVCARCGVHIDELRPSDEC